VISRGYNIDGDGSCGLSEEDGDLPATDPLLGPLAANGGPTPTHALLNGSPAIDQIAVSQCQVATDQRGIARPQAPKPGACDIGAYEVAPAGDLLLLTVEVLQLSNLAEARRMGLVLSIKRALIALSDDDAALACSALASFQADVSAYSQDGSLTAVQSGSLAAGAERVQRIICP
jgi:hypothetical protein